MARLNFKALFESKSDGSIEPKQRIRISGIEFGTGVILRPGIGVGGIDLTQFADRDLEVETDDSVFVIKGIYSSV
jgi:hypothetical protein